MDIAKKKVGEIHILKPAGSIDSRSSTDLEKAVDDLFQEGARLYVFDFKDVEVLTSAGIRVLLKLTKLLSGGGLALCNLNSQVATVLDIAGFSSFFTIEATPEAATHRLEQLSHQRPKEPSPGQTGAPSGAGTSTTRTSTRSKS